MINETIMLGAYPNISSKTYLIIKGTVYADWIFSYTDYLLGALIISIIVWNIWLSYKIFG